MIEVIPERGTLRAWPYIDSIALDAVLTESHQLAGEPTQHPVESGADISDFYRVKPRTVDIEGVITDLPLHLPPSHAEGIGPMQYTFDVPTERFGMNIGPIPISIAGPPMQGATTGYSADVKRVAGTWEAFKAIFTERKVITIVTRFETYTDMVLTSLTVTPRGKSYSFQARAQQITIALSELSASAAIVPAVLRAVKKKSQGKALAEPPSAAEESINQSSVALHEREVIKAGGSTDSSALASFLGP